MARGITFSYVSNSDGSQTTSITDPNGKTTVETYQNNELVSDVEGSETSQAAATSYVYDPASLGTTSMTDPNGHVWKGSYVTSGNLLTSTDPLNHTTTTVYNGLNEPTSITDANNVGTSLTDDNNGNPLSVSRPLIGTNQTATIT